MTSVIDLRSDTVTTPTPHMRRAMADARVGDDVYEEDPTIHELEEKSRLLFQKESGLFFPTGTMANQAAIMAHTTPGDEVIVEEMMHVYMFEVGGMSYLAGVQPRLIPSARGILSPEEVEMRIRPENIHFPTTSLICLENTHNLQGGTVLREDDIAGVAAIAQKNQIALHLDGARIFNAAAYLETTVAELTKSCDSVMFCLSKGLSAPVGSVLVGDEALITKARKCRKLLGGGMRQAGVIAAAGLVALDEMTERLVEDHVNARILAEGLAKIPGIQIDLSRVQTNIVLFNKSQVPLSDQAFKDKLSEDGIQFNLRGNGDVRMVTHKDVTREQVESVVERVESLLNSL